jgi:3-oxoacyl-[acyl-carrier-protein] synthase II
VFAAASRHQEESILMPAIELRRVVVTGLGVISPNGHNRKDFLLANHEGRSGVTAIDAFDTSRLKSRVAGVVRGVDLSRAIEERHLKRVSRMVPLAILAAREALEDAGLAPDAMDIHTRRQIGVMLGTGGGGAEFIEAMYAHYYSGHPERANVFALPAGTHGNSSSEISIQLGLRGPSHVISTGCTSSTDAIGYAFRRIRYGESPLVLTGGADAPIAPGIMTGFDLMKITSRHRNEEPARASRPFDRDRDGFVLAEGAWMLVLEDLEHAIDRGASIYGEILGYASTCDAWHRVALAVDLDEPVRAVELAMADAGIGPDQVEYVNLHGTGTELNDRVETSVMKRALGASAATIPMSSTKSMIGHPQGACGAAGVVATLLSLNDGFLPPTINLDTPDPECDLDYIPHLARPSSARIALCNCMGFGSKNSALVIRKGVESDLPRI